MKFIKICFSLAIFYTLLVSYNIGVVLAAGCSSEGIEFIPNVKIPGTPFALDKITINNDSIGTYINSLYTYGASFAAAVGMFMLVFAGWQWLMAAGDLGKVARAKSTINGVLVGLALLFGGYLLMSQISERLVNFQTLSVSCVATTPGMDQACKQAMEGDPCGTVAEKNIEGYGALKCHATGCTAFEEATCIDTTSGTACPLALLGYDNRTVTCACVSTKCSDLQLDKCENYPSQELCETNKCLNQATRSGVFNKTCTWASGKCIDLKDQKCDDSRDCDWDKNNTWCCDDRSAQWDYCRPVADSGVNCKPY